MKQAKGVPFYTVPEAAVLLGWSQEHLYRLVRGDVFPAVRSGTKYSVPARAVNELVQASMRSGSCLDIEEWAGDWKSARSDGAGGAA
jgi:excisionase family DNA binding protein